MIKCFECGRTKDQTPFYNNKRPKRCIECDKQYGINYRFRYKLAVLRAYGGEQPCCSCPGCTESRIPFLCIDHTDGGGIEHRRGLVTKGAVSLGARFAPGTWTIYRWLVKNNFPTGFRVLCHNCNLGRGSGPCPVHEVESLPATSVYRQPLDSFPPISFRL